MIHEADEGSQEKQFENNVKSSRKEPLHLVFPLLRFAIVEKYKIINNQSIFVIMI